MTTYLASWEASRYLFAALWHPDVIGTTTGVWRHVAHCRVIVLCGSEGEWCTQQRRAYSSFVITVGGFLPPFFLKNAGWHFKGTCHPVPHNTMTQQCTTWRQTPVVVPMTSGCQRAANKYRHASHEARYVVIYACSKSNEESLRYSHFLGSSTERITLYKQLNIQT